MTSLYFLGATGKLGLEIAKGLRTASGFDHFVAIVRNSSTDQAKSLVDMGWTLKEVADLTNIPALTSALENAKVVVSTLSGGRLAELESAAIQASKSAGATLYVPSQYGVDYRRWGTSFPFLAEKRQVLEKAQEIGMQTLAVFTGMFPETLEFAYADIDTATSTLIGTEESQATVSFTSRSDIGYVLAKALSDPEVLDAKEGGTRTLSMQGTTVKLSKAIEILGKAIDKEFTITYQDPVQAKAEMEYLLDYGLRGDMVAFFDAFSLHLAYEPGIGNEGSNTMAEDVSKKYGVGLESLEQSLKRIYGTNK